MWRGYVAALSTTQRARIAEDPVLSAAQSAQCSLHKRAGLDVDVQVGAECESCFVTLCCEAAQPLDHKPYMYMCVQHLRALQGTE